MVLENIFWKVKTRSLSFTFPADGYGFSAEIF